MSWNKKFARDLVASIFGSIGGTIIYGVARNLFFNVPWKDVFSWRGLILPGLVFLILFGGWFWTKSLITSINKVLAHIRRTGLQYLNESLSHFGREDKFHFSCQTKIEKILPMCLAVVGLKPRILIYDVPVWAAVFLIENGNLVLNCFYDPSGKLDLKKNDIIRGNQYLASWVLDEKKTKEFNKKRGREEYGGDIVFLEDLPKDKKIDPGFLRIRSAISVALKLQGKVVGVLVVGADKKGYLAKEDVFPIAIISQYLTASYSHLKDFCPWHRKGWRDEKFENNIKFKEFVFSPNDYKDSFMLDRKLSEVPSAPLVMGRDKKEIFENYKKKCRTVENLKELNAYLIGTFNGWNPNKTPMEKDPKDPIWRCNLHLPEGEYWYQFRLLFDGKEECIFDPKSPLWLDSSGYLHSIVQLK
jgi:hypothetical protein